MKLPFLKNIWRFRYAKKHALIDPHFTWDVILGVCGVFFIVLIIWSYNIFTNVSRADLAGRNNVQGQLDTLDVEMVREILRYYDSKGDTFDEIKRNPLPAIDPSV